MSDQLRNSAAANALLPVTPKERIEAIDVLRGVAILGVLIAYALWSLGNPPFEAYTTVDIIINFALAVLIDSKAYTLLAFLFGVGFSIQLMRAKERGAGITAVYIRRLIALIAIGLAHALLLRNGDILVPYASMGFVMLAFRNASDRTLIVAAVVGSLVSSLVVWAWTSLGISFPSRPETDGMGHFAANLIWAKYWYSMAIAMWPDSLPMFFAGLYVGRKRLVENVAAHRTGLRRLLIGGLVGGIVIFVGRLILMAWTSRDPNKAAPLNLFLGYTWHVHAWSFAAFYASTLLLLLQRPAWKRVLSAFAPFGRMALTNYLLQSIIVVPASIALGVYGSVSPTVGLLLALAVAAVQIPASHLWLKNFRFGPAEWLWRSLTYGKPQPMRLAHADRAAALFSVSARQNAEAELCRE